LLEDASTLAMMLLKKANSYVVSVDNPITIANPYRRVALVQDKFEEA